MRRPSRLTLAATVVTLPLLLGSSCAADDSGVRSENGTGVDGKQEPAEGQDGDQGGDGAEDPDAG